MKKASPKVSVILTSYNHAKYVREAIDSVINQTFNDFELIIIDDTSSDNSWELISEYVDPRIRAFRNETNMGPVFCVNKAISELASGNYIAIHHSDDVWELNKLQKQLDFLAANPNIGAVFSNTHLIDERGQPLADRSNAYYSIFNQSNRSRQEWLRHFFFRGNALCHPSILIRKQCYEDCGLYLDYLAQLPDFDMWIRLCFKYDIHVLPERLVRFRVLDNEANSSGNRPEVRIRYRSEAHYISQYYFNISSFDELVTIFPEAKEYYRSNGCELKFIMAIIAVGEKSPPWAKLFGIETLFELLSDAGTREIIRSLYQFESRELIALTGKFDLFFLESVAYLNHEVAKCNALISKQAELIEQLTRLAQIDGAMESNRQIPKPSHS
ncbi:putative glycosyltransferase EpsE [mine drainage metagenome]|uniref:Putative glycosyltransferase EpsE n=1 Tax=mine drainage metagenome TaxID=410659 RepID=A0A1J5TQA8_9ZZZZ